MSLLHCCITPRFFMIPASYSIEMTTFVQGQFFLVGTITTKTILITLPFAATFWVDKLVFITNFTPSCWVDKLLMTSETFTFLQVKPDKNI